MSQQYNAWIQSLDRYLHEPRPISKLLERVELLTGVKRTYIAQGFIVLWALYMILGYFKALICNAIGFLYPAYRSIHALESHDKDDDTKWLTYWVVFASFSVAEFFSDFIFSYFPFYWLTKVVFLIWCMLPIKSNGSLYVYNKVIRPVFIQHRDKIESVFEKIDSMISGLILGQQPKNE